MRPCGESMKTRTPCLPRIAYSAALPVSPEVAPRMLSCSPVRASWYSKSWPSSCIAMSLKASVGPLDSACRYRPVVQRLQRRDLRRAEDLRRCRCAAPARAGRRPECRRCTATGSRRPGRRRTGRASAPAWRVDLRVASAAGTARRRAPGLRAGSRRRRRGVASPRVLRYFNSALPCGSGRSAPAPWAAPASAPAPSFMRPSTVSCVRMIRSVCRSPSALSRCSTASMEMSFSARMPVMRASTPFSSATCRRR